MPSQILTSRGVGYLLAVEPEKADLFSFRRLVAQGQGALRIGEHAAAATLLRQALLLWRGPALADLSGEVFAGARADLEECRLAVLQDRIEIDLALGRSDYLVRELKVALAEHPFREGFWEQLMLALYRAGRQAEALRAYREARALLVGELGLEPGPALRRMEGAILSQDPALERPLCRLQERIGAGALSSH